MFFSKLLANAVQKFCAKHHIPCPAQFVSAVAFADEIDTRCIAQAYGLVMATIDVSKVITDIEVACDGDFQSVAKNAADKEFQGVPITSYLKRFLILKGSDQERIAELYDFVTHGNNQPYTEARISRPISISDILSFGP